MPKRKGRLKRRLLRTFSSIIVLVIVIVLAFNFSTKIEHPHLEKNKLEKLERIKISDNHFKLENNYLQKSESGLWELFLEGNPYELGLANGILTKELIEIQEEAFVEQINNLIPSPSYLKFLKYMISWFNRDLDENIPIEFQEEIYGISKSVSNEYNFVAMPYERMLNYHAAHDIGHALQDLAMVGCTAFGLNLNQADSNMIIGRNFDFYINEKFAKNKVVTFVKPDSGNNFMYVSWASMIGVVSGMNDQGLTVTLNAAKSNIPLKSATPISILAREILQYASNIDQAIAIAEKRQIFVSEQILIGSANDNNAIVIEKSPQKMGIYKTEDNYLISSNHFQGSTFASNENNIEYMKQSASVYRETRCKQLIMNSDSLDYKTAAKILRDKKGIDNANIGIGNEKAMCQMISHHAVIFMPEQLKVWVSTSPYQLGKFVCYDLEKIFKTNIISSDTNSTIAQDPFISNGDYYDYRVYKDLYKSFENVIKEKKTIANYNDLLNDLIRLNPKYYRSYLLAAEYFIETNDTLNAIKYLEKSLEMEFENTVTKENTIETLDKLKAEY
jgi:predicted choloylglycine hydrolase